MSILLNKIKESLAKDGLTPRTDAARSWLRSKLDDLAPTRQALMQDRQALKDSTVIGRMYFYFYDPKTKEQMRYYDRFPLVIPIEEYADGFLGLNLHYIHPKNRINLLDKLSDTANNDSCDKTTKLKLSYSYLKSASRAFEATPCIKRYLYKQVQSRFLEITADEWDIAALLPMESFTGASSSKVHAESRKQF